MITRTALPGVAFLMAVGGPGLPAAGPPSAVAIDLGRYAPSCGVEVRREGNRLTVAWPAGGKEFGRVTLDLSEGKPLLESMGLAASATGEVTRLLAGVEPVTYLTVGTRKAPPGRPPQ